MTTGKTVALTRQTFVDEVLSLHLNVLSRLVMGFPNGSGSKASTCNVGDMGSIPVFRKISWRRKWQPTPVLLPGKSHGQRNLVDYSPWDLKESDTTERLHFTSSEFVVTGFEIYGSISKQPRIYCCAPTRLYTEEIMFPDCVDAIAINGLPWWFRR